MLRHLMLTFIWNFLCWLVDVLLSLSLSLFLSFLFCARLSDPLSWEKFKGDGKRYILFRCLKNKQWKEHLLVSVKCLGPVAYTSNLRLSVFFLQQFPVFQRIPFAPCFLYSLIRLQLSCPWYRTRKSSRTNGCKKFAPNLKLLCAIGPWCPPLVLTTHLSVLERYLLNYPHDLKKEADCILQARKSLKLQ